MGETNTAPHRTLGHVERMGEHHAVKREYLDQSTGRRLVGRAGYRWIDQTYKDLV